ncbi:MAG: hypothetical protein K2P35_02105 [Lachnospiraceae bacterium]|nr:hypothetical protein [Lachnospiraceae bacterium]
MGTSLMKEIMKNKGFITCIMLISVLIAAFLVRAFYIENLMDKVNVSEQLLNAAMLEENNGIVVADIFADGFSARAVYILCMSFSCMIFGNFAVAGVYLNVGIQLIAVLMLFSAGNNFLNRYLGLVFGTASALFPVVIEQISMVDESNIRILFAVVLIWFLSVVFYIIRKLRGKKKTKEISLKESTVKMTENEENGQVETTVVPDSSMKEIILDDVEAEKPKFIENPLPVPKRRAHKEMDYAIEPDENDDYDITDMTGKDFFDIE